MARYCGPVCRLCRREGEKLFLKGDRCYTNKCAVERREGPPGVHPKLRGRFSEYKVQLREKQKIKRMYGLLEKPFRNLFVKAERLKGVTGDNLLKLLEGRLDNVLYRAGMASSRKEGRQIVGHGHVLLNGKPANIPSMLVTAGDIVTIVESARTNSRINESLNASEGRKIPDWIELDRGSYSAKIRNLPNRDQLTHPMKEQLVVELYSK